jgi:hypothetical protein
MDVTVGKYKIRLEEQQCVLTHPVGISFDLSLSEALALWSFLDLYRPSLLAALEGQEKATDSQLPRILVQETLDEGHTH